MYKTTNATINEVRIENLGFLCLKLKNRTIKNQTRNLRIIKMMNKELHFISINIMIFSILNAYTHTNWEFLTHIINEPYNS